MPGRRPKPTALKILEGNPGKRPLPKDEPKPVGVVKKPTFLKGKAAKIWKEFAPLVQRMGLLTIADVKAFSRWCVLTAEFEANPATFNAAKLARLDALESKFGLSPSDRARIFSGSVVPMTEREEARKNPFDQLTG